MTRRKDKISRARDTGGPTVLAKLVVLLCVVSSLALILQLNFTTQRNILLRNIKGVEEPRVWSASVAPPTCRPQRHLVFLKTHKCGSSTLQNVFMRYAFNNNLSVALPYSSVYLDGVSEGQGLKVKELKRSPFAPPSGKYHFLIHHTRLNVRGIQQLTYEDSTWITIVREPSAVFESIFHYYHLHKFYGATFDHLIWKLEGNAGGRSKIKNVNSRFQARIGRNQMTFDLGLDDTDLRQDSVMKEAFAILDQTFHLVMITERMDESLILLRHLLCWNEEDLVAVARNVRKDRYRSYLGEHAVSTLEHFNSIDVKLYAYFKERFEKQVQAFGKGRMEEEVARLREQRDKVWKLCGLRTSTLNKKRLTKPDKDHPFVIQYHTFTNGSHRQRRYCKDLIRTGIEFTQVLRWKQYSRYHYVVSNPWNVSWSGSSRKGSKRKYKKSSSSSGKFKLKAKEKKAASSLPRPSPPPLKQS